MNPNAPPPTRRSRSNGAYFWGLLLVLVGVYFLLDETLRLNLPDIGRFWPVIVIAIGGWIVWNELERRRSTP